jgi:hypothetical protein
MRIGSNPQKSKAFETSKYYHQIIIPVYIPNNDDFFKDSFNVFKICIESLLKTIHSATFISIINNGSSNEVVDYINELFDVGSIHEVINTNNIGKINAINKALVGQDFPIITISDADVLFLNNWQKEVYTIYETFSKVGAVCTTPNSRNVKTLTENIYFDLFFSSNLKFDCVKNPEAMKEFLKSIGNEKFFRPIHYEKYLTIQKNETKAVVGAGHYVCTYRSEVFDKINLKTSNKLLGKNIMKTIDNLVVEKGFWRVSTFDNYTYHMGNTTENWMFDTLKDIPNNSEETKRPILRPISTNSYLSWFKINIFGAVLFSKHLFWKNFLKYKALTTDEAKYY